MRKGTYAYSLIAMLILGHLLSSFVLTVGGTPRVSFIVSRVVWGQNLNSPTEAHPGDENVVLTVEVQNYSNETIKGVQSILLLSYPFTDAYGKPNATATGTPTEPSNVLSQTVEILPAGFFTLTFSLNIDRNASAREYSYNMTLDYFVKSDSLFLKGERQLLSVTFTVTKGPSTLECAATPQRVQRGETVDISGSLTPVLVNETMKLLFTRPNGSRISISVRTVADGSFRKSFQPDLEGVWTVNASWSGNDRYEGGSASASFEVTYQVSLAVQTYGNRLTGGIDNALNITITNAGRVAFSSLTATLTIPAPLVLEGNSTWTFSYLEPAKSIFIPLRLYAPASSIGSTYSSSLALRYRDEYGQDHSDKYPIGLIVKGLIEIVVYGKRASPQPVSPSSEVTVTATVLNKGNVAAKYVNASIVPNPVLDLTALSTTYVGSVDEGSEVPFTLLATVRPDVQNGTYSMVVRIQYHDDQFVEHTLNTTLLIVVAEGRSQGASPGGNQTAFWLGSQQGLTLLTLAGSAVVGFLLYRRRFGGLRGGKSSSGT